MSLTLRSCFHARPRSRMMRAVLAGLFLVAPALVMMALPAGAQEGSMERRAVSLTVYNRDLALVRDVRAIEVPRAEDEWVLFRDVPAFIDPTSVHLRAVDGSDLEVLEQNFRYDLVGPDRILERYLDLPIEAIVEGGRLYQGRLLASREGSLVLQTRSPEEGITILSRDKVTDIHFPELPEGLITRPTLAWLLDARQAGPRDVEVSYLTTGMNWHAEYVAVIDAKETGMNLAGWVSVQNACGASFANADLQLVAGDVRRVRPSPILAKGARAEAMDLAQAPSFEEEAFFEYHLYTLGRSTTLLDRETKQLSLFAPADARVTKRYEANPRREGQKVRVVLETVNSRENGLGMPLPEGTVRAYKRDDRERLQFIGEDRITHTPRDEKVRVFVGYAFDVVVERTELATRRLGSDAYETDVKIEVRNRKEREPVSVIVQEDLYGFWEIRDASRPFERKSATQVEFTVPVEAGSVETITFTARYTQ